MTTSRQRVHYIGAAFAFGMAAIYFLIGLRVFDVGGTTDGKVDIFAFGVVAGLGFLAWGVLLVLTDRRSLWVIGVVFQLLVFVMYIAVSGTRVPAFETWGLTLRVIQLPVFAAMLYLAATPKPREVSGAR